MLLDIFLKRKNFKIIEDSICKIEKAKDNFGYWNIKSILYCCYIVWVFVLKVFKIYKNSGCQKFPRENFLAEGAPNDSIFKKVVCEKIYVSTAFKRYYHQPWIILRMKLGNWIWFGLATDKVDSFCSLVNGIFLPFSEIINLLSGLLHVNVNSEIRSV